MEQTKPKFGINLEDVTTTQEHSLSLEEKTILEYKFRELKRKVEQEGYEMGLEDQRLVVQWLRADRETKFILNSKPVKEVKEKAAKVPKVKAPKKLSQKAMGLLYLKEMQDLELSEEELKNKHFTLTGEIL